MASGHTVRLNSEFQRAFAHRLIEKAPPGYVMSLAEARRTNEQNDKMWAMLTDVSRACPQGRRHTPQLWKSIFMQSLSHECLFEMDLEGRPFPLGHSSSKLTKAQMSELIEFIYAYGAEHGVRWSEPNRFEDIAA